MALNITINKTAVAALYPAGSTVATAVASGGTTPYTYSIATGGGYFNIDSSTGVVTTKALMNAGSIQSFSVTATDSNSTPERITSGVVYPNIQATQQSKFNKSNVTYKIVNDIDLGNAVLTIPANCTLNFQGGGRITNGSTILNNTALSNIVELADGITASVSGSFRKGQILWFDDTEKPKVWNGSQWLNLGGALFRNNGNKLEISYDDGSSWEAISDYIAAYFRYVDLGSGIGKIQISRDNTSWEDLSPKFTNNLKIKGYVTTIGNLPTNAVQGDIYGVGPTYDPSDAEQTNPIYQLYVKDSTGWVDNGRFTSISAGVVQETGNSETAVMSQAGVTNALALAELSNSYKLNKYVKEIVLATPIAEGATINKVAMHFGSVTEARWYNALFIYTSAGNINVFTNTYATQQECYDNAYGVFGTGGNYCLIDYRELDKGHNTDILDVTTFNHPLTIQFAPNIDNYLQDDSISTITNLETWQGQMNKNTLTQNQIFNNVVKELYVSNPADFDISNLSHIICHKGSVTGSQFYNALFIYPRTGSGIGVFSENYATKEECFQNAIGLKKGDKDRNYCIIDYSSLNEGATQFNADILKFNHNLDLIYAPSIGNYVQNNSIITEFTNNTEINTCIKELYLPGVNQKDITKITIQKGSPSGNTFYNAIYIYATTGNFAIFTDTYSTQQLCIDNCAGFRGDIRGGAYCIMDLTSLSTGGHDYYNVGFRLPTDTLAYCPEVAKQLTQDSQWFDKSWLCHIFQKAICIGDSITEGQVSDYPRKEAVVPRLSYPTQLAKITGWDITNAGESGIRPQGWYENWLPKYNFANFEVAIMYLGTNGGLIPSDMEVEGTQTNYYCKIVEAIKTQNSSIILSLVVGSNLGNTADEPTIEAIHAIGTKYNIPVIDTRSPAYDRLLQTYYHGYTRAKPTVLDTTHMNALGYLAFARYIFNKLMEYFSKNKQLINNAIIY